MLNTGEFFLSVPEKNGNIEGYRLVPWDQNFTYGGLSWTYIDVAVTNEKEVFIIYLYGSYESLKNAKQHYDSAVALFTQKYGKGNTPEEGNIFWTDNVNSIGLRYYESSATDGTDRSFCELYYCNIALSEKVYKENQPDI